MTSTALSKKSSNLDLVANAIFIAIAIALVTLASCSAGPSATSPANPLASVTSTTSVSAPADATISKVPPVTRTIDPNGKRVAALDFAVSSTGAGEPTSTIPVTVNREEKPAEPSPKKVVAKLLEALVDRDAERARSYLTDADQQRLGVAQRLIEEVNAAGWTTFTVDGVELDEVSFTVMQTPKVNEIDGVVAESAVGKVQTIAVDGGYKVEWTRRTVEPQFAVLSTDQRDAVSSQVTTWLLARQACEATPPSQYRNGLAGVVGLADALCKTVGTPSVQTIGELDLLDEPTPILQAFGSGATVWARVAVVDGPVPMAVVVAPLGTEWIVVGIARPSISES